MALPSAADVFCENVTRIFFKSDYFLLREFAVSVSLALSSSLLSKNLTIKIYRTTILPVVLYGCETWSLTLRDERRLRVFENRVLRRAFGPRGTR